MMNSKAALTPFEKSQQSFLNQPPPVLNNLHRGKTMQPTSFPSRAVNFTLNNSHSANAHFHSLPHPKEIPHPEKLKHTHQCLVCNLGKLTTKIENMLMHQIEKACHCEDNKKTHKKKHRSKSHKRSRSRNANTIEYDEYGYPLPPKPKKLIVAKKIGTLKNILLGVYKTEKCYDAISRPYVRGRIG